MKRPIFKSLYSPDMQILECAMNRGSFDWHYDNLSDHYWRFYWMPKRHCRLVLDGKEIWPEPNQFILITPNTPFAGYSDGALHQFVIHFKARHPFDSMKPEIYTIPATEEYLEMIDEASELADDPEKWGLRLVMICGHLCNYGLLQIPADKLMPVPSDKRILEAMDTIEINCDQKITSSELAQKANLNVNSFIRLFKIHTGMSPQEYLRIKRIERVTYLLSNTEMTIDEIADATGFCSRSHLTQLFVKLRQISPAAYRQTTLNQRL